MAREQGWMQRLMDGMDLDPQSLPGVPVVELAGTARVLIEGHCGVTEYSSCRIGVKVCYGTVCVRGCGLELAKMTREQLVISGQIEGVELVRGRM